MVIGTTCSGRASRVDRSTYAFAGLKGPRMNKSTGQDCCARVDDVVPVAAKAVWVDLEGTHLLHRDLASDRVASAIEPCPHDEPATRGRVADEINDGFVAAQRSSSPVD